MAQELIHVIEDEEDIAELIRYHLAGSGFQVEVFHQGADGLKKVFEKAPSLVLLDLMLPGMEGTEVCKRIRANEKTRATPIIMVTAKGSEADIVKGLESGADDYLTKPFSPQVLTARVKAVLRRTQKTTVNSKDQVIRIHDLIIHPGRHEVLLGDQKLSLTHSEFQILHFLARSPGWVFTRSQIVDSVRGDNYAVTDRSIDVQIVGLRRKLGAAEEYIETVRGVGYRMREQGGSQ